jgi:DNA repair exonuclease SbcCD ATPase subunit
MFRRRPQALPPRRPHPDPRIEAEFQRIISLLRAAERLETELDTAHREISRLRRKGGRDAGSTGAKVAREQAEALQDRLPHLDAQIRGLHEEISKPIEPFDDEDLLFL